MDQVVDITKGDRFGLKYVGLWIVYCSFEAREETIYFYFIYNNFMLALMPAF